MSMQEQMSDEVDKKARIIHQKYVESCKSEFKGIFMNMSGIKKIQYNNCIYEAALKTSKYILAASEKNISRCKDESCRKYVGNTISSLKKYILRLSSEIKSSKENIGENQILNYLQFLSEGKDKKWIAKAIEKPGALHKQLGVPQGEKIPAKKLTVKSEDSPKLKKRKILAQTLKKIARKKKLGESLTENENKLLEFFDSQKILSGANKVHFAVWKKERDKCGNLTIGQLKDNPCRSLAMKKADLAKINFLKNNINNCKSESCKNRILRRIQDIKLGGD